MRHRAVKNLLLIFSFGTISFAQTGGQLPKSTIQSINFVITGCSDSVFTLPDQFIIAGSETVWLDSARLLREREYRLDARNGTVRLRCDSISVTPASTEKHLLKITYLSFPFSFKNSYRNREQTLLKDTGEVEYIKKEIPGSKFAIDDFFGANLRKSGSIMRGFEVGTNRDLSLNSGFRMQMSGNLTDDIDIVASLTDESTPIQPEGTTQTLQEVDKVFIELRSPSLSATLGDFNLNLSGNEFGNLTRKLQGAKGSADYRFGTTYGTVLLSGAVARGKFTTNRFPGADGIQGPYRLHGDNNNRAVIVIAGSERVYIDGEKMSRGETADYIIDYTNAEVTFNPKRLVNRGSRIVVDFEYSDRQFNRNLFVSKAGTNLFGGNWQVNAAFFREGDDENSLIDISLSDSDKQILQNAGGDRQKAVRSGILNVGQGKGQYAGYDSTVYSITGQDSVLRIYRYSPADTVNAIYSVSFSNVGPGNGNYGKVATGQYQFVGLKQGDYDHVFFLPMPQSHIFTGLDLNGKISKDLEITAEYAAVNTDLNRFSSSPEKELSDHAFRSTLRFSPGDVHIGEMKIGSFDLTLKERFMGEDFRPLDRVNDVEFNRTWNAADSAGGDEEIREGILLYKPVKSMTVGGSIGHMARGDLFSSDRRTFTAQMANEGLPKIDYHFDKIKSQNKSFDTKGDWLVHRGDVRYQYRSYIPRVRVLNEYLSNRSRTGDTLKPGSYRFNEIAPGLSVVPDENFSFDLGFGWRSEDSAANKVFRRAFNTFTQNYSAQVREWRSISSRLDITVQTRKFSDEFRSKKNENTETFLLRWLTRISPGHGGIESDWFYEVATERSAKLERYFQAVPKGTGSHVYLGDVNGNRVVDQEDFRLSRFDGDYTSFTVPGGEFVPVINLNASTRIRLNPSKLFSPKSWAGKGITALSTESYIRVEEKSTEPDRQKIYLLRFGNFLSDKTTIVGSILCTQDIFVFENSQLFSLRFRYAERRGLSQYTALVEKTYSRERSLRLKWRLVDELANQTDYTEKIDILGSGEPNIRARRVYSQSLSTDWSYRPMRDTEIGFVIGVGKAANYDSTSAYLNDQSVRFIYSIAERGQLRMDFTREEVDVTRPSLFLPFELTDGKIVGKTWLWQLNFEYRVTNYMQATINYNGRTGNEKIPVHIGKAEVRAFF